MHKVNDTYSSVENVLTVQEITMKNLKIRVMAVFPFKYFIVRICSFTEDEIISIFVKFRFWIDIV